ncbi:MAG: hypothetical protein U9R79_15035 [Armatimonadota bacterium]|nr:hypothetical protein [Armatimonadota bacterium]
MGKAVAGAGTWLIGAMTTGMCTLGLRCAWLRLLRSTAGIGLRLLPSLYDGQGEHKRQHASGRVRSRRQTRELCEQLQAADRKGQVLTGELLQRLGVDPARRSLLTTEYARTAFGDSLSHGPELIVQYSGGADSTVAAVLSALAFERVHLLTFHHPFIRDSGQSRVNAQKLADLFGHDLIVHRQIDATEGLKALLFGDYLADLRRFGTAPIGWPCLACKMSFDIGTLRYAAEHGVKVVADGSDLRVSYQLSQGDPEMLAVREQWYGSHGISFVHPVAQIEDTVTELLLFGLEADRQFLLYPKQGHCIGNDMLGTAYKRFYYIPRYGLDHLRRKAIRWAREKINTCDSLVGHAARQQQALSESEPPDSATAAAAES